MPCLTGFIGSTMEGNRNENLFRAINHVYNHNKKPDKELLLEAGEYLNKYLQSPLSTVEVSNIVKNVTHNTYGSKCEHFQKHCQKCKYGHKKKPWRIHYKLQRIINKDKQLQLYGCKGGEFYLWDIEDLSKVSDKKRIEIWQFRESKNVTAEIDRILLENGYPIGKAAWQHYKKYMTEIN